VATGPYAGEGFDCPALDTLFLAAPVANKGSLTQYAGRVLRSHENKTTAEVHDYLDERTGVLAAMLAKRAPGYTGLGFPDPRRLALTPSAGTDSWPAPQVTQYHADVILCLRNTTAAGRQPTWPMPWS
jgi:hypothetical protein